MERPTSEEKAYLDEKTWYTILRMEKPHWEECPLATLAGVEPEQLKAAPPAERAGKHAYAETWNVDRCGTLVKYLVRYQKETAGFSSAGQQEEWKFYIELEGWRSKWRRLSLGDTLFGYKSL
jgi:hypothetical protein